MALSKRQEERLKRLVLSSVMAPLLLLAPISLAPAQADMIDTSGMEPWETCALCHGLDGNSRMGKFPRLSGQNPAYIEKQLRDFREAKRDNDGGTMTAIASGELAEENISVVARYFSSQKPPIPSPVAPTPALDAAKQIFLEGDKERGLPACRSCHVKAASQGEIIPFITAQHQDYLLKQLTEFKDAARKNDKDAVMRNIVAKLSSEEINNLSAYIASLPRQEIQPTK